MLGADEFLTVSRGKDAKDAFWKAVREAQYMSGHGGYTGTIAEKGSYVVIPEWEIKSSGMTPREYAGKLMRGIDVPRSREIPFDTIKFDQRIADKWGPAGAILLSKDKKEEEWIFFGFASS